MNFTLPLWSLHSLCEDALNGQCWIEDDGLCGTDGKGLKNLERTVVWDDQKNIMRRLRFTSEVDQYYRGS